MFYGFTLIVAIITFIIQIHPSTSIIGGNLVSIKEYPFFAYIATYDGSIVCGGSIIQADLILTAAHCLEDKDIQIYVGVSSVDELKRAKPYKVKKIIKYPSFKDGKSWFDIGLIRLSKKLKLGPKVSIIPIATTFPKLERSGTAVGFGDIHCKRSLKSILKCIKATHLRATDLTIVDFGYRGTIKTFGSHSNICHGDSGGPMIYDGEVIGVSATIDQFTCHGGSTFAPVYINSYWIKKHMKHFSKHIEENTS